MLQTTTTSNTNTPPSLFARRGLPAIKLTIPSALENSGICSNSNDKDAKNSSSKSSTITCITPKAAANDSDIHPVLLYNNPNIDSSFNTNINSSRRESISSLNSAKYSINSLLEDASPADRKTLTKLFDLMDRLSMPIHGNHP